MPLIGKLKVDDSAEQFEAMRLRLLSRCDTMLRNIATKIAREYVFLYPQGGGVNLYQIIAGPGSAATFRTNFMLRLAESFYNLRFIFNTHRAAFDRAEFNEFERCYNHNRRLQRCRNRASLEKSRDNIEGLFFYRQMFSLGHQILTARAKCQEVGYWGVSLSGVQ
jgi:hypothetical protein